jgi:CRISPR-associated protein Cas2
MNYLICYDISQNRRRSKVARILEKSGTRLQKSVFMVDFNKEQIISMQKKLEIYIKTGDSLIFMPSCRNCFGEAQYIGLKNGGAMVA